MKRNRSILLALGLLLPGLLYVSSQASESTLPDGQQVQCEDKGGQWNPLKTASAGQCNLPTLDAGKICNDSSECQSACVAEGSMLPGLHTSGICYGWSLLESECLNPVSRGVTQGSTCNE